MAASRKAEGAGALPDPYPCPPTTPTAYVQRRPPHTLIAFTTMASEEVRNWLSARSFWYSRTTRRWCGKSESYEELVIVLKAAGLEVKEVELVMPGASRREKKRATEMAAEKKAAEGPRLSSFDWSGFPAWAEENLTIKDKQTGQFVPFKLNPLQLRLFDASWQQWLEIGRVRMNVLKHRQPGFSTLIQALCFYLAFEVPGVEALVTAHRDDSADAVFRRTKIFEARCPDRMPTTRNNRKEIQWEPPHLSAIRVATAGGDEGLGRGDTRHVYHASEPAHYNERGVEAMANVLASIPDGPGTCVWRETTARGLNHFYDSWCRAETEGYRNFFVGWLEDPSCRLPGVSLTDSCWQRVPKEWLDDEPRLRTLAAQYGLGDGETIEALAWRRRAIAAKCSGIPALFSQEFPTVENDAFISTGSHVFPLSIVDPQYKTTTETERSDPAPRYVIEREDEKESGHLVPASNGPLRIWRQPEAGVPYVVSGDVGRGVNVKGETGDASTLDYTTFRVVKRWPDERGRYEEVAAWHGRLDPDKAAGQMDWLGRKYNEALLVPEANHYGLILVQFLLTKYRYPKVFRREKIDRGTRGPVQQALEAHWMEYGWFTGPGGGVTKAGMIEHLHRLIRDREIVIHEPEAWGELRVFMRAADGSMDAESGKHDDRVMALAIAACILALHPEAKPVVKPIMKPVEATESGEVIINFDALLEQQRAKRRQQRNSGEDI